MQTHTSIRRYIGVIGMLHFEATSIRILEKCESKTHYNLEWETGKEAEERILLAILFAYT